MFETKKKIALSERAKKDELFMDYEPMEHQKGYALVMLTVSDRAGKRITAFGEVASVENPFLKAVNNATVSALAEYYGEKTGDDDFFGNDNMPAKNDIRPGFGKQPAANGAQKSDDEPGRAEEKRSGQKADVKQTETPNTEKQNKTETAPKQDKAQNSVAQDKKKEEPAAKEDAEKKTQKPAPQGAESASSQNKAAENKTTQQTTADKKEDSAAQQTAKTQSVPTSTASAAGVMTAEKDRPAFPQDIFGGITFSDKDKRDFRVLISKYKKIGENPETMDEARMSNIVVNDMPFVRDTLIHMGNATGDYAKVVRGMKKYLLAHNINPFEGEED